MQDRRSTLESPTAETNRRRSRRVVATVDVRVRWTTSEGFRAMALGKTNVFNAHGALLSVKSPLAIPFQVELSRPKGEEAIPARVVDVGNFSPNFSTRVAVELVRPSDTFWGVSIPLPPPNKILS